MVKSGKKIDLNVVREKLNSSLLSDVLDGMGIRNQCMAQGIRPAYPGAVVVGRAHTMLMVDLYEPEQDTFKLQLEGIDSLKTDNLMVVASNGSTSAALWGELLSTAAKCRGATGAVIDGLARDIRQIEEMPFPVFAAGIRPISSKGRVIAIGYGCRIKCGGVYVEEGDLVVGDVDGVTVVPDTAIEEAVERALVRAGSEKKTRKELLAGSTLSAVYAKYGTI
ncbi:TPA: RraA family protein [Candidatus Bathyarchaeota archaeon]|nr:RraA family protein [Candidatus Bathyarchaeota archaeon]